MTDTQLNCSLPQTHGPHWWWTVLTPATQAAHYRCEGYVPSRNIPIVDERLMEWVTSDGVPESDRQAARRKRREARRAERQIARTGIDSLSTTPPLVVDELQRRGMLGEPGRSITPTVEPPTEIPQPSANLSDPERHVHSSWGASPPAKPTQFQDDIQRLLRACAEMPPVAKLCPLQGPHGEHGWSQPSENPFGYWYCPGIPA